MKIEITARGRRRILEVTSAAGGLTVHDGEESTLVRLEPVTGSDCWRLLAGGSSLPVRLHEAGGALYATIGPERVALEVRLSLPIPSRRSAAAAGSSRVEVRAPMPGLVVAVPVTARSDVTPGTAVAVIEAMKMQMEVPSPAAGCVAEVRVAPGQEVAGGQVLVVITTSPQAVDLEGAR